MSPDFPHKSLLLQIFGVEFSTHSRCSGSWDCRDLRFAWLYGEREYAHVKLPFVRNYTIRFSSGCLLSVVNPRRQRSMSTVLRTDNNNFIRYL